MRRVTALMATALAFGSTAMPMLGIATSHGAAARGTASMAPTAPTVLRAGFEQERHVPGFTRPLRSAGEVLMVRGEGLRWETRTPFPSVMIVRGDTMRVRDAQGRDQRVGEGAGGTVPRLVQELLQALLAKDRVALTRHFAIEGEPAAEGGTWRMRLVPKSPPLANLYERIEVAGTTHVERIELHGRDGGRTLLRFNETRVSANASDAERRALD